MYTGTLTLAVLAVAKLTLAATPGCLLAAVNKFDHPADQKTLCGSADKVGSYIDSLCGSNADAAKKAFKSACDSANYSSSNSTSSSSSSSSASGTVSKTKSSGSKSTGISVYTTTYYDAKCSCTKTSKVSSAYATGSSGFATGTAPVATGTSPASPAGGVGSGSDSSAATGSPIAPATGATGTPSGNFAGAANQNVVSGAGALFALGALVMML